MEASSNKYFAFISYKREDEEWAVWFHHELENYHLPATLNGRSDLPTEFRPVFRDIDELKAGNLPEQIYNALASSAFLVVICSPNAAKSKWVNKEIMDFIEIGKIKGIDNVRNIFPFIVDGHPHAQNETEECFPTTMLNLQDKEERIGGNVNESGRDKAFVKVLAGMLPNVAFDELWNRYEKAKAEEQRMEREKKDSLLRMQSRVVAEKALAIAEEDSYLARLLALEVLPKNLDKPDRPYTIEAERALRKACRFNGAILKGHALDVNSAVYSPDKKFIVSASYDKTVRIWDAETGLMLRILNGHNDIVNSADFSSDGKFLITASRDRTIRIWNADSGCILKVFNCLKPVELVHFSPDGKQIVSVSYGSIMIWDVKTGKMLVTIEGDYAAFSPDGKRIVTVSKDETIQIWDTNTGVLMKRLKARKVHRHPVYSAIFSPDGKYVASASMDIICVWDVITGKKVEVKERIVFRGHVFNDLITIFNSDDTYKVAEPYNRVVNLWEARFGGVEIDGSVRFLEGHKGYICSLAYSPDGECIVSASTDKTLCVWNANTGVRLNVFEGIGDCVSHAVFSPDGHSIVSASLDGTIRVLEAETGKVLRLFDHYYNVSSIAVSPNGKRIAIASEQFIRICDIETGAVQELYEEGGRSVDFSPDGKRVVASILQNVHVWNSTTGIEELSLFVGPSGSVSSSLFSPDGDYIVSAVKAGAEGAVYVWNSQTGKELKIEERNCPVGYAAFSPDGKQVVLSECNGICIWDLDSGLELGRLNVDNASSVTFSPDGRKIITACGNKILVWSFPLLQDLIDQTRERFKNRSLTKEERKLYYLD